MMSVYKISAVTLLIKDMERSCNFYSKIPGFKLVYGGSPADNFTSYKIGESNGFYLNLELFKDVIDSQDYERRYFGKIIFYTEDVDKLYFHFRKNRSISELILFENEPSNASWGERYFHIRDPDGYLLSFAMPLVN